MFTYELGAGGHSLSERNRKRVGLPILRPSTKRIGLANGGTSTATHISRLPFKQLPHRVTRADTFDDFPRPVPISSHSMGGPSQSMGGPVAVVPIPSLPIDSSDSVTCPPPPAPVPSSPSTKDKPSHLDIKPVTNKAVTQQFAADEQHSTIRGRCAALNNLPLMCGSQQFVADVLHYTTSCRAVAVDPPSIAAVPVPSHSMGGPSRSMGCPVGVVPVPSHPMGDLSQSMGGPTASRGSVRSPQGMGGPTISHTSRDPKGVNTVYLPKTVLALLQNPPRHLLVHFQQATHSTRMSLLVADTGATDHMLPDKAAFISYYPVSGRRVRMGNNSFAPIAGHGSAIISLNGKKILIRDCLHVPDLRNPLYSLQAHQRQRGCGFIGMSGLGMHVFFPSFIIEVDTTTDCHLLYEPIGRTACLADLDYVQPKYLVDKSASSSATALSTRLPAMIEPDDDPNNLPNFAAHWPKRPPSPVHPPIDMSLLPPSTYTKSLKDLDREELIQRLYLVEHPVPPSISDAKRRSPAPLDCMEREEILILLHHPNTSPPAIRPCDTPNASDTKSVEQNKISAKKPTARRRGGIRE